jgi:hypothetical protein
MMRAPVAGAVRRGVARAMLTNADVWRKFSSGPAPLLKSVEILQPDLAASSPVRGARIGRARQIGKANKSQPRL